MIAAAFPLVGPEVTALFLPIEAIAKSNEHTHSKGTLTLSAETVLRSWIEIGESVHRAGLRAQFRQRHGGHMAVEFFEFGNPFWSEQVGTARQDLAELDEGRTQLFHGQAHLHRGLQPRQVGGVGFHHRLSGTFEPVGQAQAVHHIAQPVADQHTHDGVQASDVARGDQGFNQHGGILVSGNRSSGKIVEGLMSVNLDAPQCPRMPT